MRVLTFMFLTACSPPRIVLVQHPLEHVEEPRKTPLPAMSTTDNFPEWCHGSACEQDDDEKGRFRAVTPEKKGAERK